MRLTSLTLTAGLVLVAIAILVTLSSSPVAVVRSNWTAALTEFAETKSRAGVCQAGETLPAGVSMIRLSLTSDAGPWLSLTAQSGSRVLTSGAIGSGWLGGSVAVPVRPIARTVSNVRICVKLGPTVESVGIVGTPTNPAVAARGRDGKALPGRFKIEYLRTSSGSWWSEASKVVRRMGLGRAPSGTWIVLLLIALMGTAVAVASWLILREL